jgi:hypothetical protein
MPSSRGEVGLPEKTQALDHEYVRRSKKRPEGRFFVWMRGYFLVMQMRMAGMLMRQKIEPTFYKIVNLAC